MGQQCTSLTVYVGMCKGKKTIAKWNYKRASTDTRGQGLTWRPTWTCGALNAANSVKSYRSVRPKDILVDGLVTSYNIIQSYYIVFFNML